MEGDQSGRLVEEPDPHDVDLEADLDDAGQAVQYLTEVQGGGDQPAGLGKKLQLAAAALITRLESTTGQESAAWCSEGFSELIRGPLWPNLSQNPRTPMGDRLM